MLRRRRIILLFLIAACAAGAAEGVKVDRAERVVVHRRFDRKFPPKDMPPLKGEEAAMTISAFAIASEFSVQVLPEEKRGDKPTHKIKIVGVNVSLSLKITIWVPDDAPFAIIDHEEGHRRISDYFYKDAEKIARSVGQTYVGQIYSGEGEDVEAATKEALGKALDELSRKYMAQTQVISARANDIFDELTDHGRNQKVREDDAVRDSIDRAKKEKK